MNDIELLIADDHVLVRAGIRALVDRLSGVRVVAEAGDGREVLRQVTLHQPHIVLLDISMPGLNGLEVARCLSREFPLVRTIILSMHSDEEHVWQALCAGASGYLLKGASVEEFELAIRAVANGETYLSPPVSRPVIAAYVRRTNVGAELVGRLTVRQREVLTLIAEGQTTKQIALTLDLSAKTIEKHRSDSMKRIGVRDVAGLVRYAVRIGLVHIMPVFGLGLISLVWD
jgi:DNA-binding NarL/FixJ family response regulator